MIRFSVWLVSGYAHVFVLLSIAIVICHTTSSSSQLNRCFT